MYSALPNARRSDLAPQPSTDYDPTHWQTGLLASNFTIPDQPRPSDDDATFARNWNPPSEKNRSSRTNNSSSRPDLKRIGGRTPSAVRFGKRRTTPLLSPPAHLANLPQLPATASNPSLDSSSPHPPQGRWTRPASTRTFFRTRTRRCSSTTSRLALSSPLSKGMFRPHPLSTYRQKITCSTRVHVLIPKLQTAETTRSTQLHRPRRLRPSSYTRRMPPPLQSLRLRRRSLSPANIPNNGQQTPWRCCFTRTPNQTCRRQTALRLLTMIEPNRLLHRPQFRPRPWRWPPLPRHKLHLPSTTHDRLVAAAVKPPRSWPTAYQHRIPRRWTETTTPSAIPCKRQDINRVRVSSLTRAIDSCSLSLSVSPSLLFPFLSTPTQSEIFSRGECRWDTSPQRTILVHVQPSSLSFSIPPKFSTSFPENHLNVAVSFRETTISVLYQVHTKK